MSVNESKYFNKLRLCRTIRVIHVQTGIKLVLVCANVSPEVCGSMKGLMLEAEELCCTTTISLANKK